MPTTITTPLRARLPLPDTIERGQPNDLRCPLYLSGALTAPASGTVAVYDAAGTARLASTSVTVTNSVAGATWTPGTELAFGENWRVDWSLVVSGTTYRFQNPAMLVRCRPSCPIIPQDMYDLASALSPDGNDPITAATAADHDRMIEVAWVDVQGRLLASGRRPWLVIGGHALRDVTLYTALARTFDSLAHRNREAYGEIAKDYQKRADDAWSRVALSYDMEDDGTAGTTRRGSSGVLWIGR